MLKNKIIVCLGNGTSNADKKAELVALEHSINYNGLLNDTSLQPGCYHTSIYDISLGELSSIITSVDLLVMLDQPIDEYYSIKDYYDTVYLVKSFNNKTNIVFQNKEANNLIDNDLEKNKSFCILPWIHYFENDGHFSPCCESRVLMGKVNEVSFHDDQKRIDLQKAMLEGASVDDYCANCINLEKKGHISSRQLMTKKWSTKLNLHSIKEIVDADLPILSYDLRPSNLCNMKCRTCGPSLSSLIEQENKIFKIHEHKLNWVTNTIDFDDIIKDDQFQYFYFGGGEPTIIPKIEKFLSDIIKSGKTDTEIVFNTNAYIFTKGFKELIEQLSNVTFVLSIDGFETDNDYIRSESKWNKIISNLDYILDKNFKIGINIVVSMYSIFNLDKLLDFLYQKSNSNLRFNLNLVFLDYPDYQSPYLIPNKELVIDKLKDIQQLDAYKESFKIQLQINELLDYYEHKHIINYNLLEKFFTHNDNLDQARNTKLADYIPELEECRNYLTKQI